LTAAFTHRHREAHTHTYTCIYENNNKNLLPKLRQIAFRPKLPKLSVNILLIYICIYTSNTYGMVYIHTYGGGKVGWDIFSFWKCFKLAKCSLFLLLVGSKGSFIIFYELRWEQWAWPDLSPAKSWSTFTLTQKVQGLFSIYKAIKI